MPWQNLIPRFRIAYGLALVAVTAALLGWMKLRDAWQYEKVVTVLDARQIDSPNGPVQQLYNREIIVYQDENEKVMPSPSVRKRSAWCGLAAVLVFSMGILLTAGRHLRWPRFVAATALSMVAAIIALEICILILVSLGPSVQ